MMTGMPWTASIAGQRPVEFSQKKCDSDCAAQEHVADMPDRTCRIQTSWAHIYTVHDAAAAEHAEGIFEFFEPFLRRSITTISKKAVGLK